MISKTTSGKEKEEKRGNATPIWHIKYLMQMNLKVSNQ